MSMLSLHAGAQVGAVAAATGSVASSIAFQAVFSLLDRPCRPGTAIRFRTRRSVCRRIWTQSDCVHSGPGTRPEILTTTDVASAKARYPPAVQAGMPHRCWPMKDVGYHSASALASVACLRAGFVAGLQLVGRVAPRMAHPCSGVRKAAVNVMPL